MLKRLFVPLCLLLAAALLTACGVYEPAPVYDPHAGQVQVADGAGGVWWVKDYDTLPVMALDSRAFLRDGEYLNYIGTDAEALRGVDVSEHQMKIDWAAAAADGLDFAMIRVGYRGWSEGKLFEDLYFRENLEGALANGLRVGVYFFSQAITPEEAREEAMFLLERIADWEITLPVCFDWEPLYQTDARTAGLQGGVVTDCALAFGEVVSAAGYTPAVYFYRDLGYRFYELDRLAGLVFWAGAAGDAPDFRYRHQLWQYSFTGKVSGIAGDCDLDLYFLFPEENVTTED